MKHKLGFGFWFGLIAVVLSALVIYVMVASALGKTKKFRDATPREVALTCTTDMATQYHIHPNLKIVIDGKEVAIPTDIGVTPTCMNSIHTHGSDGQLHVEAPVKKDFTLGDFFAVWKQPFDKDHVMDKVVTPQTEIVVTVNGKEVDTFENTLLVDLDNIVIEYKKK